MVTSAAFVSVRAFEGQYSETSIKKILVSLFLIDKHFRILLILYVAEKVCIKSTYMAWVVYCGRESH